MPNGIYNLLSPNIDVIKDTIVPNVSNGSLPIVNAFTQIFRERTSAYNTESLVNTSIEKSATQVRAELGNIAKMSVSALNLFFDPWESLVKEMVRRMKRKDFDAREPGGSYIAGLHKRLIRRGSEGFGDRDRYLKAFFELDIDRLRITKPIGAGSEASTSKDADITPSDAAAAAVAVAAADIHHGFYRASQKSGCGGHAER